MTTLGEAYQEVRPYIIGLNVALVCQIAGAKDEAEARELTEIEDGITKAVNRLVDYLNKKGA